MENFQALTRTLKQVSKMYQRFSTENLWWRGQPESGLSLKPCVFRDYPYGAEQNLILNFDRQAPLRYSRWPDDRCKRLVLMQHFGLPTRLLDWSMGVLTALYFAVCEDRQDKDASLWALNPIELNRHQTVDSNAYVFHHGNTEIRDLVDMAFKRDRDKSNVGKVLAMTAPELDLRMLVQWSMFTIHGKDVGIENLPDNKKFAGEIIIPEKNRHAIRKELKIIGLSRERLFPDMQSLSEHIKNEEKNRRMSCGPDGLN